MNQARTVRRAILVQLRPVFSVWALACRTVWIATDMFSSAFSDSELHFAPPSATYLGDGCFLNSLPNAIYLPMLCPCATACCAAWLEAEDCSIFSAGCCARPGSIADRWETSRLSCSARWDLSLV